MKNCPDNYRNTCEKKALRWSVELHGAKWRCTSKTMQNNSRDAYTIFDVRCVCLLSAGMAQHSDAIYCIAMILFFSSSSFAFFTNNKQKQMSTHPYIIFDAFEMKIGNSAFSDLLQLLRYAPGTDLNKNINWVRWRKKVFRFCADRHFFFRFVLFESPLHGCCSSFFHTPALLSGRKCQNLIWE